MSKIKIVVNALESLKLEDIIVYDMRERSPFFDYFILSTASNTRQLQAAIKHLKDDLSAAKYDLPNVEGNHSNAWVLMDAKDIVVNIFTKEERKFYNMEKMWLDVPQINIDKL
ncbi:MAG: ribosome silencing factor [Candidatus Izemoplasmataceae bacterium]|jgi:ribosome-associated protein|uniref:ribosome silencing factor n=1 Tax=Liberiplasma polymorphum TaxID=3374570 RepID=UPI0037749660